MEGKRVGQNNNKGEMKMKDYEAELIWEMDDRQEDFRKPGILLKLICWILG